MLQFESGPVEAEAEFIIMDGGGLVLKFGWLVIRDDELADLVYPPTAKTRAERAEREVEQGDAD